MHISIFDLDQTLIKVNCSIYFYSFLRKQKIFKDTSLIPAAKYWMQYRFFDLSSRFLHEKIFNRFLKGQDAKIFFSYVQTFWEKNFEKFCNRQILRCLEEAKAKNHYLMIFSNSPYFLVSYLTNKVPVDQIYATEYAVDDLGKFFSVKTIMNGEEKKRLATKIAKEKKISHMAISVYSDSYRDLPLLEMAGEAIVVNPDKRLKKIAKAKLWKQL